MNSARWLILIEETDTVVGLLLADKELVLAQAKNWNEDENKLADYIKSGQEECLSALEEIESPQEAVFIFSPFWISNQGELLQSKKKLLKDICERLKLTPLGFLVGDEIFSQFYEDFAAVYLGREHLRVTVVKDQAVKAREELENGDQFLPEDIAIFLKRINSSLILPENLVFWGGVNDRIKSKLIDFDWESAGVFENKPNLRTLLWPETFKYISQLILKQAGEGEVVVNEKEIAPKSALPFDFTEQDLAGAGPDNRPSSSQDVPSSQSQKPKPKPEPKPKLKPELKQNKQPFFKKIFSKFSFPRLPRLKNKRVLILIPLVLAGLGLLLGSSWYLAKLDLEIYVTAKEIVQDQEVTLDSAAGELRTESGLISLELVESEISDQASIGTSGEKLIGDKASGELTIFNRTEERETLTAGTELIGPGNLRFVLDNEVTIASKSADLVSGVDRWGEVKAEISAKEIGAEYNLAADSEFTVDGFSRTEFLAKNESDLEGGTSRQVRAVGEEDMNKLREQLRSKLEERLLAELKDELDEAQLIEGSLRFETITESFSAEVGEEKDELSLELGLAGRAVKLNQERLEKLALNVLGEDVEEGFILPSDSIEVEFIPEIDSEEAQIQGELKMKAKMYPEIDKQEMAEAIAGKSKQAAKITIRSYPRVYRFTDQLTPGYINWWPLYPPQVENINIIIKE